MLEEQYPGAQVWIDEGIPRNEVGLWNRTSFQYGDWLDPLSPPDDPGDATTSKDLVADAYLIHSTELLSNISSYLNMSDNAAKYARDRANLTTLFRRDWISRNGTMANETQTGLTLPLYFNLFGSQSHYDNAVSRLTDLIAANEYKVGTGFAGTHILGHTLTKYNAADVFYKTLLQEEVPGWLYQVIMNGTTTWERWNSMLPNGTINPGEMTSFNHYSVGSAGSWMHENIGGLKALEPGFKRFGVDVKPGGGLTSAETSFISPYGLVETRWRVNNGGRRLRLGVTVPPNTEAVVNVPGSVADGRKRVVVGSGMHRFESYLE